MTIFKVGDRVTGIDAGNGKTYTAVVMYVEDNWVDVKRDDNKTGAGRDICWRCDKKLDGEFGSDRLNGLLKHMISQDKIQALKDKIIGGDKDV